LNKKKRCRDGSAFFCADFVDNPGPTGFVAQPFDRFKQQTESQSGVFPQPLRH
jgi:hypothetical protein